MAVAVSVMFDELDLRLRQFRFPTGFDQRIRVPGTLQADKRRLVVSCQRRRAEAFGMQGY